MNRTFTTLGKLPNTFTRALTLLVVSALMSVSSLYGQTYLSQDFEAAWVGNNPSAPGAGSIPAGQNWTQNRTQLVGNGQPRALTNGGGAVDVDWIPTTWDANLNRWSSFSYTAGSFGPLGVPTGAASGNGAMMIDDGNWGNLLSSRRVESPTMNLTTSTSPYLRFAFHYPINNTNTNFRTVISTDGGTTWRVLSQIISGGEFLGAMTSGSPWQRIAIPIHSSLRTANVKVAFEAVGTYGSQSIFVDAVTVQEFTPVTITSAGSGYWSAPSTWVGGVAPSCENNVVIAAGHRVTYDYNMTRAQNVTVAGTLTGNNSNSVAMQMFGDLTVNSGGLYNSFCANGLAAVRTYLGGNLVNNGSVDFTRAAGLLAWFGSKPSSYSGTGTLANGFVANVWHANSGGVTYNAPVEVRNTCGLYTGTVNPNGNLTLGNVNFVTAQTIERSQGSFTSAPIYGPNVVRSVTYTTTNFEVLPANGLTLTTGFEIPTVAGARLLNGTLNMSTFYNVQLGFPMTVGTGDINNTGALTLSRGILVSSQANMLTINLPPGTSVSTGTTPSTASPSTTAGSYVTAPFRVQMPFSGTTARAFPVGVGTQTNDLTGIPTKNVLLNFSISPGTTPWQGQLVTVNVYGSPSGTGNAPINAVMGKRTFGLTYNGGPTLPTTATLTLNAVLDDGLFNNAGDLLIAQGNSLNGPWTSRMVNGTGTGIITGTSSRTTTIALSTDSLFCWATSGPTGKLWVGGATGNWGVAGNWSPSGVPTATDNVRINNASVTLAGGTPPYVCNNLYIDVPSTLTASANTLNVNGLAFVNGTLTVSGGTVNVNGVPSNIATSLVIAQTGQLNISSGTVNVAATSGDNNRFMSGAGTLNLTGTGILNVNGGLVLSAGAFNMNGTAQLNMNPQGTRLNLVSNTVLDIGSTVFVNATGGTITMVNPSANNLSGTNDVFIGGIIEYNNKNFTGSTLRFGNGTANASATISAGGFQASFGSFPTMRMGNLVINNPSGITRDVRLTSSTVFNNVTITAGALNLNGNTLNVNGNIVNDGTINTNTSAASTIHFTGSVAQTLSGRGNYAGNVIRNLIVTNFGGGVNLNQNVTVTNQLTLNGGNLTGTGTLTLGNSVISNTLAINRNGGTLGLTPVWNIANPNLVSVNLAYNTPSLSPISYEYPLIPSVAYVAGNELPVTDTLNTLTINAQFGVTFNRSVWARAASPLTLTNGIATFSGANAFNATLITATLPAPAATAASWVNGTVSVNINTATNVSRSFPVGGSTAGSARTFTINNMQNAGAGITTVSVTPVTGVGNTPGAGLTAVSTTRAFNAQVSGFALTAVGTVAINYGLDDNLTTNTALVLAESRIAYSATAPPTSFSSLRAAANTVAGSVTSDAPVATTLGFFNLGLSTGTTTVVYTGPNNGSWNTPANWDGGAVPTASNDVRIDGNLTVNIPSGSTANARNLIVVIGSTLNDSASTLTIDSNLIVNGTLNIRAGNMLVGGVFSNTPNHIDMGAFATINLSGGTLTLGNVGGLANRNMRVINNFNMTGGNFNLYGQITFTGNVNPFSTNPPLWTNFTMRAGNFNIYQQGTVNLGAVPAFNASAFDNTNIYMLGGTLTIVDPNVNATTDINIANNGTRVITGTTLAFGDGVSSLAGNVTNLGFSINIAVPFGNVVVNNPAGTNRIVRLAAAATFNNLTVTAGTFNSNALGVTLLGNILNNGTVNFNNTSIVSFIGTSQQTVSGTGSFVSDRIATLTISNSSDATPGVEFNVNVTVTNALNLTLGRLGGTGTLTLGNSVASTTFALTRTTGSLIVAPTFNFTGVTTTYAYNAPTPAALVTTTGLELPAAVNTLTFSNAGIALGSTAFIVGSPVTVNTTLNLSGGIVQTTATNLITLGTGVTAPPVGGINAFINGPLAIQLNTGTNTSRTFALGKGTQYRPLTIGAFHSNSTLQTYTAEVITGSTTGSPLAPLNALTSARYWKVLNTSSIFSTATPTIAITTGADDNIGMPYLARVSQGNFGSSFASRGGSATGFVVTSNIAFTGDSIFTIGTEDASLPIIWTGGAGTSNWGDALNWSNNAVPTSSNIVNVAATIAPIGAFPTNINVNVPTANVGTLIVGPNIILDMKGSTFNISNKYTQIVGSGTVFANSATINMLGGDSFLVAGGIFNGGNSTLNFSSSSLQYIRPTAGTFTFFNMNLTNGDKNFFAGSIYIIGGNLTTDATSTISLSAATNTTFNVGASFTNNATGAGTNVANVIVNMNGLQSVINSPNAISTPSISIPNGFLTSLVSPITFNTGRTFTVNGRLNAGNNLVNGTGTFLLASTGTLGTTQATGGLAATIDPGLTRTYTLGCQIDYNANGAQVIDALSHNTNCGIRVSNVGTKTLNGNLTIATTGGGIQRGAIYAQNPAVFADGGFVTTITGLTSPSVNVEKGAGYLSSTGGGLTFGGSATGAIIRVPDATNLGNLELNFVTVTNGVNLQSSEPLLVSNITVNNLNVGVTTPANGGVLNVSNSGITPLVIAGNFTIGNTGSTATGTINGATNIYTNITLNGNFSSANTNATQTIIGNTGFNTLIMNGTPGQSFVFSGAAAVSYLAAPGAQGTTGSSIIRINNPANVTFGDGVIRTYTNLGVIELTGNGTVAPTGSTTFAYSNVSGTLRYANSAPITTTDAEYPATNSPFNLQIFATGAGSVTLHAPRVVNGTLFLQSGLVNTTSTNTLSLGSSNLIAGTLARTAGWVNGPLTRWVSNAIGLRDWTVGTATLFRPASITFNTAPSVGGYVTATYVDGVNSTPLVPTLTDVITLDTRSNAYWQIDTLPAGIGASNYNISLNTSLFNGITDPASVRLIRSDDAGSTFNVTGTHFDGAIGYYNRNVVTNGFGRYYLGANATTNPLPVNLVSLTATVNEEDVVVSWRTASETDNKGFEVERSADGRTFEFAGFVEGTGNSNVASDYALTDDEAFVKANSSVLYYRLKQIDFDGTVNYSKVIKVSKESDNVNALSAYPNPFASNYQVSFNAKQAGAVTIEMVDIQGKLVLLQTASISKGVNTVTINNVSNLQVGVYFVKATVDGETQVMKLVKN